MAKLAMVFIMLSPLLLGNTLCDIKITHTPNTPRNARTTLKAWPCCRMQNPLSHCKDPCNVKGVYTFVPRLRDAIPEGKVTGSHVHIHYMANLSDTYWTIELWLSVSTQRN